MPSPSAEPPLNERRLTLNTLEQLADLDLPLLLNLQRETIRLKPDTVELYQAIADRFLRLGEPLIAYDMLSEGLKQWPQDLPLQQSMALALARSGATTSANALLQKLVDDGQGDATTLGLLARTHKDLWSQTLDEQRQRHHLALAADCYAQAYARQPETWTGINAATMALLRGRPDQAAALARQIQQQCHAQLATNPADPYWVLATLGEAALILGRLEEAEDFYRQAIAIGQGRFGDLSSSYRNAQLLLKHLGGDRSLLQAWFQMPRVAVFCGHMIDLPERPTPRFPPELEPQVYQAIYD
ncbi:MAG TPA: TRAFs-binding domain-containing protein [Candidatus Obscuribacterales bacterium]